MPSLRDYVPGLDPEPTLSSFIPGSNAPTTLGAPLAGPQSLAVDDQREAAGMTEVGKGFRSGRLGSEANYLASQEFSLRAAGRHDEADAIRNQIGALQQRAGVFAPRVQKVEDAWANPTDAPAWLGGVTGQVGASMIDSIATGMAASKAAQLVGFLPHPVAKAVGRAGSWIGAGAAAVPNMLNARGETANRMVEDPTLMANTTADQRNDAAWLSGGAQGLIDTALPAVIINRLGGAGIAKGIHKLPVLPRVAADVVGEGTQEVIQEGMKKGTLSYLNPNRDTSGDASDYLNSFVSGLGMTPHSAASIAVDNAYRRLGVKGDGQRGDDIDLSGKDITTQLAAAAKGGKGRSLADSIAYSELLHGTEDTPDVTDQSGLTRRRDALLSELAKYPNAAALARPLTEMNDRLSLLRGVDAMDEAADFLAPKLGLTTEQLAKKGGERLKNSLQVDRYDFGKGQIDTSEMPARTPEQQAAMAEAAQQHKTQTSRLRSLLENTYTQMHADAGTKFNPSIKKLLGDYAPELAATMSPGVAEAPTAGEIARAKRIGSSIGSALGDKANGALVAVAQRLRVKNSPVFNAMHDEAVKVAEHRKSGGHAAHAQHMMERDAAALALLDAAPEFDARMAKKEGVDLRLEGNAHLREQLLSHMEDHADGEGSATQTQLEEQFGKEAYAKMMEIVGGPIAPRHTAAPKATEQKASPKLSSDDITDGETSDYEKRGHEKSHTAVDPGSLVFGHSQTEARSAADAFKPGADGKLMKLIPADRVDSDGRRSLNVMQLRMAQALRSQSKDYSYGRQKDGKVGTSAKELMDRQGVHGDQRVALMGQYLAQENPGADHTDFVETVKALPTLRRVDELMSEAVQGKPLSTPEMSRSMRGQLKRVMNYVANPEQFLSTDVPLSAPARAAQNLAIAKAVHKAHADMRGMIDGHESLAPMVAEFKATHGRAPSTHELADHFFDNRFLVHAEKLSDRDYLKIDNDEFTALHREGTKLLRTAEHQAHESGGNVGEHKAGMNLIHFRSLASTQKNTPADQKTVAIPAHKLVRWVRDMRNKHTKDMRTGDNTRSYSDNSEAEQYLADLTEGINALMTQKLVRGKPWIVNAAGEREHFGMDFDPAAEGDAATPFTRGIGPERVTSELAHMHRLGHQRMGDGGYMEVETPPKTRPKARRATIPLEHKYSGGIPPSLSVGDGRTFAEMKAERAKNAGIAREKRAAEEDAALHAAYSEKNAHGALEGALTADEVMGRDRARDEELGQDEVDMQDADHVRESEEMMSGSKRDREERDHQWKMTQVTLAAADRLPEALTKITAFTKAKRVAERLWRDYIGDKYVDPDGKLYVPANAPKKSHKEQTEAHARAVGAILSYVTATERTEYDPTDVNKTRRGDHFIAPLAALLTPNHMAAIAEHYPNELKKVSLLRAKTASVLLRMAYGGRKATITAGQLKQAVDSLTGYADAKHDLAQAQAALARADGAEEKQWAQAAVTAAKSASPAKETEYRALLTKMAQPYFELTEERGYKTRLEEEARLDASKNPDRERHFVTPFVKAVFGGAPVDAPALTAEQQAAAEKFDETGKGVEVKRVAPTLSVAGSVGASDSGKVSIDTTPKPRAISRKPKADPNITVGELRQVQAERPTPAGDYRKTSVDLYSEVAADTAAAEQGVDNVAALAGALAQSARSQKTEGVVAKRENNATIADAAAKLNAGATIQQVNAVKNSLQTADTARAPTPEEIKTFDKNKLGSAAPVSKDNEIVSTRIALRRMLGDKIKTLFEESFPDMQGGADWNETKAIIRIATASSVPMMQRGYHEAMHAFYSLILKNSPEAQAMTERVTSDPKIIERMAAMLKDSPEAVEQMRTDAEERAAYAYQFWAAGMLDIGKKPETFFEKVQAFMRRVLGAVRESDKALAIFTAFHDGKLTEPSAAGLAITKVMETGEWRAKMLKRFDKQAQAAYSEVMATINVGMNSESPTARAIAMMFYSHPSVAKTAGKPGYIDSAQLARHQYENLIQAALRPLMGDNLERDMAELAQVLNGKAKAVQPHVEKAAQDIYAALHRFHKYAREAGVDIGVRDDGTYFPRVIQLETMIEKKAEFIDMLVTNYPSAMAQIGKSLAAQGKPAAPEDAAALIHQSYIDRGGIENAALSVMREDGVLNPFFASQNERKLHWIRDEHIAPFLSTDVVSTLTRYFSQGTRSAEYVRRFGEDGQKLKDMMARVGDIRFTYKDGSVEHYTKDGPVAQELMAAAAKAKAAKPEEWVNRRMEDLQRSFGAMEGSLGKDISAGYRQFQGNVMTYQVLRTLPLSLFSAMLDPNGLRVAGGTSDNMWYAYKRGLLGVFNTWKDLIKGNPLGIKDPDKYEVAANAMGVIAPTMYLEQYGGVHSSEYSAGAARKINHKFFLANGLTSWDRDMRIAATKAAMESIVSNEANTIPAHSARWLKELGLQQGDGVIRTDADGELVTNKHALAQMRADEKGTTKEQEMEQAEKDAHKIAVAVNRWVARAIIAPNAALRPSRASDPHYAMFFQLKSFTYAFTETTLKFAMAEAEEGNLSSSLQLLRGVPIMIAADMTKAVLTNGGSLPGYMANWTMADWVLHGLNRSGNLGTPQLALDALHGAHGPIAGAVATVGGPTVSQVIDLAAGTVNGKLGTEVVKSIPLFNKIGPMAHTVGGMLDMGE